MKNEEGKILKWDYDYVNGQGDGLTAICLSHKERAILLKILDYVGWATRWQSPTGEIINQDVIESYKDTLLYKLGSTDCGMDCADVISCVVAGLSDGSLDVALCGWIRANQGNIPNYPPGDAGNLIDVVNTDLIVDCDIDLVFGFTLQLTQVFNLLANDLFEVLEVITNWVELVAAVCDSIPFMSESTDLIAYMQDAVRENYLANYDVSLENLIACELMCIAIQKDDCSLTWRDLLEYFSFKLAYELEDLTFWDWANYVLLGVWDGDEFVYLTFMTIAAVLALGGDWFGITLHQIERVKSSLFNDPNADWEVLCDECLWRVDYVFAEENLKGWTPITGQWHENGNFWATVNLGGVYCKAIIDRTFVEPMAELRNVRAIGVKIDYSGNHEDAGVYLYVTHAGGEYTDVYLGDPGGETVQFDFITPLYGVSYIKIIVREDNVGDGGYGYLQGVIIVGHGTPKAPEPGE